MTKARIAISLIGIYVFLCAAAGVELAELSLRLPKHLPSNETRYSGWVQAQFKAHFENVSLVAADGATLKAWYVEPAHTNGESVVLLHGITDNRVGMSGFGDIFLRQGYSVLLPDSRAHGESGGTIATYGILERQDVRRWVGWLRQRDRGCTYLFGESMGAAIGLQAAAVTPQICAVAVESPYSNFREIAYERLGRETHLGALFWRTAGRPVIEIAIAYASLRYGVKLTNASPHTAVEETRIPMLLIAGTADRNIPMHHTMELYRDCASHCALWIVPGADHGGASTVAPVEFRARLVQWFKEHDQSQGMPVAQVR